MKQIETFCPADKLDELAYVVSVLKKLEADGVKDPLNTDFTKCVEK